MGCSRRASPRGWFPVFTREELTRLEQACAGRGFAQRRDTAIIAMFRATGIRLSDWPVLPGAGPGLVVPSAPGACTGRACGQPRNHVSRDHYDGTGPAATAWAASSHPAALTALRGSRLQVADLVRTSRLSGRLRGDGERRQVPDHHRGAVGGKGVRGHCRH